MSKNYSRLKVLVIGLGSMGKRRIRNLKANCVNTVVGFDLRKDRRDEAQHQYAVPVFETLEAALNYEIYDAWIISVPPDVHHIYMKNALEKSVPAFIEASVVDTNMQELLREAKERNLLLSPSCTLYFHPAIIKISSFIKEGALGKLSNIIYHSGQYLPDWHTYEKVSEYYVSQRATGGAREIVPFEMTWITLILGFPKRVACFYKKTIEIEGAEEIEDTYNLLLDYDGFMFNLCVDVVSRNATRRMVINGDEKQLYWDWADNAIRLFDASTKQWETVAYEMSEAHSGYNKNITETMYNQEIDSFLHAVVAGGSFPNTLAHDYQVLQLLYAAERSCDTNTVQII